MIRRDAARHFVGGAIPRTVAVLPAQGGVLAAAAAVSFVEAVRSALRVMHWQLDAVVPAHGAWLAAVDRRNAPDHHVLVAIDDDAAHLMRSERGVPVTVRRVPAAWTSELVAAAGTPPGRATILGERGRIEAVTRALAAAGWATGDASAAASAAETAARHAAGSRMELVPPTLAAERRRAAGRLAMRLAASAATLVIVTAAVALRGEKRELAVVQATRAAIQDDVAPLLAMRDSIARLEATTATIRRLETASPRWTRALFDLALLLPSDAHLTALHARADTLIVEATGERASAALQAMRRAGSLTDLRLLGSVERELRDGETALERFRMRAVLEPLPAPPDAGPQPPAADSRVTNAANEIARRWQ